MKRSIVFVSVMLLMISVLCSCTREESANDQPQYSFRSGKTVISINDEMSKVLDALGQPKAYDESASCAFDGLDKVYKYSGFEITTYPSGNKDFVYMIRLTDDTVATPEGIRVGDSRAEVISAYGSGYTAVGNNLQYKIDSCILQFIFRKDRVSSIKYIMSE